ncbi:MAG: nucleoside recognition protein [Deltaproteobacteria bacterium]|nr:MAG: nucleoside recognition protein [Deltaproteobacteria bacterium]
MEVLGGSLAGAALTVLKIAPIIIVLTIVYQLLRDWRGLSGRVGKYTRWLGRLGLGRGTIIALGAGLFLGIVYGAGVLINEGRSGNSSKRELFILAFFLSVCHAVIEDTLLFVVIGGSTLGILGPRIILALAATWLIAKLLPHED